MHDDANSTAKWLSSLSEDGVGFKVWDSTIDLEMDRFEPKLTGDFESEFVITPLPTRRDFAPFDEAALMAELAQPFDQLKEEVDLPLAESLPADSSTSPDNQATDQSSEVSFSLSQNPSSPSNLAPQAVPLSSYTWQSTRQPPPFDASSVIEPVKPSKREKPVIIIAENYQVVSGLGKGVMCNVFKVKDLTTGKLMVLKLLPKEAWNNANCLDQLKREAQTIASFEHANLIPFRTIGFTPDSQPFIVMDLLHGITLSRAIAASDGLPLTRVVQVFEQLCRGLAIIHEKGIPHRDLRPENIMFLSKTGDYNLKLVDFGIAKLVCEGFDPMKQLAATGEVFGNPPFMSPEECRGEKIDNRSDIYSLGCVMYMAMTGKPPFHGCSTTETLNKQQNDSLPHPSKVKPAICKPSQTGWVTVCDLEFIVMRCLSKDRDERYQTVEEILQDLDKLRKLISLQPQQKAVSVLRTVQMSGIERPPISKPKPEINKSAKIGLLIALIVVTVSVGMYAYTNLTPKSPTSSSNDDQAKIPL